MKNLWNRIMNEPVLLSALVAALLVVLVEFQVPLTDGQVASIQGLVVAAAAIFARSKVSPTRKLNGG